MQANTEQNGLDERRGYTSASNAHADMLCPGRHLAQRGIPEPQSSEDAEFGTKIHAALANEPEHAPTLLDPQQRRIFDSCREIEKEVIKKWFGEDHPNMRVFREKRFWCRVPSSVLLSVTKDRAFFPHSARVDVVMRAGKRGLVMEYKTLPGEVDDSTLNLQVRDQVVLTSRTLFLENVAGVLIQPLVSMKPVITEYDAPAISRAEAEMWERVRKSNDPNSPRVAGDIQCKFCLARHTCYQYQKFASSHLPATQPIVDVPIASWTPEQCAAFLSGRALAQRWLDDATETIKARLRANPEEIPGWGLRKGKTRRAVTDPQKLFERFKEEGGELEQYMATIKVGLGKLESEYRNITGLKGRELHHKFEKLIEGLYSESQDEPSIIKQDKPQPKETSELHNQQREDQEIPAGQGQAPEIPQVDLGVEGGAHTS